MAGHKPSVNHFAFLDRSDPGDKCLSDFDAAKNAATPAASLTQELFGNAYPSARDYIIRRNQLERQAAQAKRRAAKVQADGAKLGGYSNGSSRQQQQPGMSGGYKPSYNQNGASRRQQQPGVAQGMEAPLAPVQAPPPQPPSLYDINEFPSLN
jgi:hypothetical protein